MPAAQELLINVLVATTAVASRQFGGNYESVMVFLLLPSSWLVAVQAIYTVSRVHAHFVLVDYRVLGSEVTLRAFASCPDQGCSRLLGLDLWSCTIEQKRSQNKGEGNHDGDEHGAKRHSDSSN
jgi:hypothetical protein